MSVVEEYTPSVLQLTERAVANGKHLMEEEANDDLKLRVFVTGGGCSGFQYGFTFDELAEEDDTLAEKEGVVVLVDPLSYQYIEGAELDYTEGLERSEGRREGQGVGVRESYGGGG